MRGLFKDLDRKGGGRWSYLIGTESMFAGAGAGLVSSVVTCPLDVVKTKLQAQGALRLDGTTSYDGLFGTFGTIWREEGLRGCYRGLGPTVFGYLPTWAIYFTVYDAAKARLVRIEYLGAGENDVTTHVLAAMVAGASSTTATNPLWVIKTRFMTQRVVGSNSHERYRHTVDAFRRIYAEEGFRGFYRGLMPSLLGISHVAIQFPLYEQIKLHFKPPDGSDIPFSKILIASACSKMLASVITYPHEVIRTRLQIYRGAPPDAHSGLGYSRRTTPTLPQSLSRGVMTGCTSNGNGNVKKLPHPGMVGTFKYVATTDGLPGFYRGMGVNLIRTVPNSALTILTYELIMRRLTHLTHS